MLLERLQDYADFQGDCIAYETPNSKTTYKELWEKSYNLACCIKHYDHSNRPIFVVGHKEVTMVICFLACALSGHPYVPIDTAIPMLRIAQMMEQANPVLVLTTENTELVLDEVWDQHQIEEYCNKKMEDPISFPSLNDVFYIIFTSGTSGVPKGVAVTYGNLIHFLHWMHDIPILKKTMIKRVLNHAIFSFDLSVADLYYALYQGATEVVIPKEVQQNFPKLFHQLRESNADLAVMTPSFAEYCLLDSSFDQELLPELKVIYFCGEFLQKGTVEKLWTRFPHLKIINAYGPTETTVSATYVEITPEMLQEDRLPVGKKDINQEFCLSAEAEIMLFGDGVSEGYIDGDTGGFSSINGHKVYFTGDIGEIKNGYLYCLGRKDKQVKRQGYRIELLEIENQLQNITNVENAAVIAVEHRKQPFIIAFTQSVVCLKELKKKLSYRLPVYMVPDKLVQIETIPLTANGKKDYKKLEEMWNQHEK